MIVKIIQITVCFISIVFALRGLHYKPFFRLELLYILPFCVIDFLTSWIDITYIRNATDYSWNLYHLSFAFTIAEYVFIPIYIAKSINRKINLVTPLTVLLLTSIISGITVRSFSLFPQVFLGIYITYFGFRYFYWLLHSEKKTPITQLPSFWIVMGVISCYASTIPLSAISYITDGILNGQLEELATQMHFLFLIANTIMHIFFTRAFLCNPIIDNAETEKQAHAQSNQQPSLSDLNTDLIL